MSLSKSFKNMSNIFTISASLTESGASTFTNSVLEVNTDPLSQEAILILSADMDVQGVNLVATKNTAVNASLSTVARTTVGGLNNNNVIAQKRIAIRADAANAVSFESQHPDSPTATGLDYIGLVVTDNIHLNIEGSADNTGIGTVQVRLFCIRAEIKDSGVFAALVQSELLS